MLFQFLFKQIDNMTCVFYTTSENCFYCQLVAADIVQNRHIERSCCRSFFHKPTNVKTFRLWTAVNKIMYNANITMKSKYHVCSSGKYFNKIILFQPMRMMR